MPFDTDYELLAAITKQYALPDSSTYASPATFNRLVRSRLVPRNRFNNDHHDTCMYIERSKNLNVVAYTANLCDAATKERVKSGAGRECVVAESDPIHAYFINLEPSYVAERRRKGIEYDCDDLNLLERTMAYGCSAAPIDLSVFSTDAPILPALTAEERPAVRAWWGSAHALFAHFVALPAWPGVLMCLPPLTKGGDAVPAEATTTEPPFADEDSVAAIITRIGGTLSVMSKIYVKSIEPKRFYQLPSVEYIEMFGVGLETGKPTYEKLIK